MKSEENKQKLAIMVQSSKFVNSPIFSRYAQIQITYITKTQFRLKLDIQGFNRSALVIKAFDNIMNYGVSDCHINR